MIKPGVESDKITRRALFLGVTAALALALLPLLFWGKLAQQIPLFYSLPWGEAQIANKMMLFIPAVIATAFIITNLILARTIHQTLNRQDAFSVRILWVGTTFAIFLGLATIVRIILLFL